MAGQVMHYRWEDKAVTLGWEDEDGCPRTAVMLGGQGRNAERMRMASHDLP